MARRLSDDWRPLMGEVRRVTGDLAEDGRLRVTQTGREGEAEGARGPIRRRLPG